MNEEIDFSRLVEPLRRELHAYAYRMLGGFHDADDAIQDAYLKAWRARDTYAAHASVRAWLYRIVTNTCLDMLRGRARRLLPQDIAPAVTPGPPDGSPRHDLHWLEPYPDALMPVGSTPEHDVRMRQGIRLAFVRAVQLLPARQRAALILHDVLDWSVAEVATILDTTDAAVNSALQRARATVAARRTAEAPPELERRSAEVVDRYLQAWETGDFASLASLLTDDAILTMPPWLYWLDGRDAVIATHTSPGTWDGPPRAGRYRMMRTAMNGQPAALAYVLGGDGRYAPVCMTVLALDDDARIADLTVFVLPELFAQWGFPATLV